ncbi:RHS repeat domain-containing protein, partial [Bacteroides caccae]|uniref:RHS repeat domain-containing protein n=2 Tax=Bacteroides caccae TaxID=47678 RepID=UPI001F00F0CE
QTSATGYDVIDDLSLSYAGNRLKKVTDRSTTPAFNNGFEFKDGIDLPTEYEYDENGNLTKDLNKNITAIQYNCLNLPGRVMFANGNSISYLYDAAGRKLRTVHALEGDSVITDYCGNVVYENGVPQILLTEVGYVSLTDGQYHYNLKDHQGNNRVVVDEEGAVEEVNDYYAFGGLMSTSSRQSVQPYKYNGKELDRKGGLGWYDYGARMYDAALGRFMKTDRFSEKYVSLSPYQYGANNPVNNIDVNGDNVYVSGEFSGGRKFNDIAVGEFDSPQEFLNSPYNSYGASDDMSINTYGFSEGYMIPTSKEQDDIIRDTFISISKNESYDFLGNNCSTVVQKSLEAAGIITFTQKSTRHRISSSHYLGESSFIATISTSRPVIPSVSFRAIIKNNPQGKMIYR